MVGVYDTPSKKRVSFQRSIALETQVVSKNAKFQASTSVEQIKKAEKTKRVTIRLEDKRVKWAAERRKRSWAQAC